MFSSVWLFCNPMDCSPPGSSVHGISQARILEWVAVSFSRLCSWPRDRTSVSCIGRQILFHWATREALTFMYRIVLIWKKIVATHTHIETEHLHLYVFYRLKNEHRNSLISIFILFISQSIYMKLQLVSHIAFRNKETRSSESINCL